MISAIVNRDMCINISFEPYNMHEPYHSCAILDARSSVGRLQYSIETAANHRCHVYLSDVCERNLKMKWNLWALLGFS